MSANKENLKVVDTKDSSDSKSRKSGHNRDWAVRFFWKFFAVLAIVIFALFVVGFTMVSLIPAIGVSLVESSGLDKVADASLFVWMCAFIIPYAFACLMMVVGECVLIAFVWKRIFAFCQRQADKINTRMDERAVEKLTGGRSKNSEKRKLFSKKSVDGSDTDK